MILTGQKRASNGMTANVNYTWSTCEGTAQSNTGGNPLNVGTGYTRPQSLLNPPANSKELLEIDKGPCSFSPNHILNLIASAETPRFDSTAMRMLASGWRLSGIFRAASGNALRVVTGVDRSLDGLQTTAQRVNQVMDNVYGNKTLSNWFNPAAFAQPALGTYGNSGYNAYKGPGSKTLDLSLVRSFPLKGAQRIEARIEAFNALNWLRPLDPVTTFSSATFGQILTAADPRIMQFAMKYQF